MKNILMAAPVALAIAFFAIPAQAGGSVDITVGERYPGYDPSYHPQPYYDDEEEDQDQISCWQGKRIVR